MTRGTGAFQEEETRRANSCARIVVCVNCYESMHMNSMQLTLNLSSQGPQAKKRGLNYLKLNEVLSRTQLSSCFCEHVCKLRSFYVSSCRSLSENIGQKANGQLARKKKRIEKAHENAYCEYQWHKWAFGFLASSHSGTREPMLRLGNQTWVHCFHR